MISIVIISDLNCKKVVIERKKNSKNPPTGVWLYRITVGERGGPLECEARLSSVLDYYHIAYGDCIFEPIIVIVDGNDG